MQTEIHYYRSIWFTFIVQHGINKRQGYSSGKANQFEGHVAFLTALQYSKIFNLSWLEKAVVNEILFL